MNRQKGVQTSFQPGPLYGRVITSDVLYDSKGLKAVGTNAILVLSEHNRSKPTFPAPTCIVARPHTSLLSNPPSRILPIGLAIERIKLRDAKLL